MDFYKVHCTNCGNEYDANFMAADVDKLIQLHLKKMKSKSSNPVFSEAEVLFDEIRIGMYLTKFEMVRDQLLNGFNILKVTGENILSFIEQRYQVKISLQEVTEGLEEGVVENDDPFADILDSIKKDDGRLPGQHEKKRYMISPDIIDSLCIKMLLYTEVDTEKKQKRDYIERMINFITENSNMIFLECNCKFGIDKDDKGNNFLSTLTVKFIDGDTKLYQHMVCPHCGESFFIHAGRYQEYVIVMLGSARVGKTAYLAALIDEINPEYGQSKYQNIMVKDTSDARYTYFTNNILKQYRLGKKIIKTDESKDEVALFSLEVVVNKKTLILTLVDLPGEVFVPRGVEEKKIGEASGNFIINHRKICYSADAFWFCIAPIQIDHNLQGINNAIDMSDKVELDMSIVLSNIENTVNVMRNDSTDGKNMVPTAIIVTQSDLIAPEYELYRSDMPESMNFLLDSNQFRTDKLSRITSKVRTYLTSPNVRDIVPKIDGMFEYKNYFSVAAYGTTITKEQEEISKAPYGIILPFLWTLSTFDYLKPVKLSQEIKRKGIIHKTTEIVEEYIASDKSDLFI